MQRFTSMKIPKSQNNTVTSHSAEPCWIAAFVLVRLNHLGEKTANSFC